MLCQIVLAIFVAVVPLTGQTTGGQQPVPHPTETPPETPWPPPGVHRAGKGISFPRVAKTANPSYTADAVKARVEGRVVLEAIVHVDGTVGEVRVKQSLDKRFGLDDQAVESVKKWQFTPGQKDGVVVPVLVEIELTFTLRKK